jgi:hypothetical protein
MTEDSVDLGAGILCEPHVGMIHCFHSDEAPFARLGIVNSGGGAQQ